MKISPIASILDVDTTLTCDNVGDNEVSILIPTYNREKYIVDTLKSCFNQTYEIQPLIIIYDDGSTDNTQSVVKQYIDTLTPIQQSYILYYYSSTNKGVGHARKTLLNLVHSEYACWLDSDDLMHPDRVKSSLEYLIKNKCDVVYCTLGRFNKIVGDTVYTHTKITADVSKYERYNFQSLKNNTTCASAIFNRKALTVPFSLELSLGGEDVLWVYQVLNAGLKIGYINEMLYYYRSHGERLGLQKKFPENLKKKAQEDKAVGEFLENIKRPEE